MQTFAFGLLGCNRDGHIFSLDIAMVLQIISFSLNLTCSEFVQVTHSDMDHLRL